MSRSKLCLELDMTDKEIRVAIDVLKKMKIVAIRRANDGAKGETILRLVEWDDFHATDYERAKSGAKEGPSKGQALNSINQEPKNQELNPSPGLVAAWNPWASLMEAFKAAGVEVTERIPRQIAIVNDKGNKVGQKSFEATANDYCQDDFLKKAGRSVNGFLNNFDRLRDRRAASAQIEKYKGMKPWEIERDQKIEAEEIRKAEHRKKFPCRGSQLLEKHLWYDWPVKPGWQACRNCTLSRESPDKKEAA